MALCASRTCLCEKDHQTAVFHYRQLLAKPPSLVYPRFDLALILAEDQQFRAAEQEFKAIQAHLPPELAKIARNTQVQIAENEAWQPIFICNIPKQIT